MVSLVCFVHRLTLLFVACCLGLTSFSAEAAIKRYQFDVSYISYYMDSIAVDVTYIDKNVDKDLESRSISFI